MSSTWTPCLTNVISDGATQLWYFIDGRPITQNLRGRLDIVTPEEYRPDPE